MSFTRRNRCGGQQAREHIILIDDARLFINGPPAPHKHDQWPSIGVIIDHLRSQFQNTYIAIWNDVVVLGSWRDTE